MPDIRRWALTIAFAGLVAITTASLWFAAGYGDVAVLCYGTLDVYVEPFRAARWEVWRVDDLAVGARLRMAASLPMFERTSSGGLFVGVPLWPALLVLAFMTWRVWRRRPIIAPDACRQCGYSLRGLTSRRCPECGLAFVV